MKCLSETQCIRKKEDAKTVFFFVLFFTLTVIQPNCFTELICGLFVILPEATGLHDKTRTTKGHAACPADYWFAPENIGALFPGVLLLTLLT